MEGLLALPPESLDPKLKRRAEELLDVILDVLGPQAKAKPDGVRFSVILTASLYQPLLEHYAKAPSRKKLRQRLEALRNSASGAAAVLESRDPYLLAALHMHGLPEDEVAGCSRLDILKRLCLVAYVAVLNLPLEGPVGGQKVSATPPKRALAFRCLEVFERYRPGKASSTEGGDFRAFVGYVYEIATGEQDADLEKPVKEAIGLFRDKGFPEQRNPFTEVRYPQRKYVRDLDALRRS